MDGADVPPEPTPAENPYRHVPAGPGRPHRPARVRPGTYGRPPVVRPEDVEVVVYGRLTIPPDVLRLMVEAELEMLQAMSEESARELPRGGGGGDLPAS